MLAQRTLALALFAALACAATDAAAATGTRLLRFPDVCGDRVVFSYAGDLWTTSTQGGTAIRLTAGPGVEQSARFSPDCSKIAFTGQYGGDDQVFVVPAGGGEPVQLTYYPTRGPLPQRWGFDHQVHGWTPDGSAVLFRSWRDSYNTSHPRLYTVSVNGGMPEALPMPSAGTGHFSPDGKRILYSPKFRDFRTWNRYHGGWAQDLYIHDFAAKSSRNVTNEAHTDRDPIWMDDAIYFVSDRDDHLNLYRLDPGTGATRQLTRHRGSDVRWASGNGGLIAYELDGAIRLYDTRSDTDRALTIHVPSDLVGARAAERSVKAYIEDFALSANGKRLLFTARGEVFSVPVEHGITLDLTHTPGAHEREATWSRDGSQVAYVSDETGEEAIWIRPADGSGKARALTHETYGRLYAPRFSPDGEHIAFVDSESRLHVVSTRTGRTTTIADDPGMSRRDHAWSPGGGFIAYSTTDPASEQPRLHLHALADGRDVLVSEASAYAPAFSPDGQYLYFIGDREWTPQISGVEWNFAGNRSAGIFAVTLHTGAPNPFAPRNDRATDPGDPDGDADDAPKKKTRAKKSVETFDLDGIAQRLVRAPIEPDNIGWIGVTDKALLYIVGDGFYYGREGAFGNRLKAYSFDKRKASDVLDDIDGIELAADADIAVVRQDDAYKRIEPGAEEAEPRPVALDGLQARVDPQTEYREIFAEVWRRYRDHFYVRNMHGHDWNALRAKYEPLLQWVGDRSDLNYLLGQMVAELNVGHAYVSGGDFGMPERPNVALLGARFEADPATGRYRIASILPGSNDEPRYRSPLTEVGVDARTGDYVLAINGQPLTLADNPYRLLRTPKGQLVQLALASRADGSDRREVLVEPIDDEMPLHYLAWVERNRAYVENASDGVLGYLHIPDMGADGIREFIKAFYPQLRKQGLVIDVRDNGGGNVSSMIIERLSRRVLGLDYGRGSEITGTYPQQTFIGHLAALCNGTTASDGDIFSYMFKQAKLGPLIGERTWGGVVGINDWGPLIDGGSVNVPQFATADTAGRYVIEGEGVAPDIEVENDVATVLAGRDPQLDRAISELKAAIARQPVGLPPRPADPVKTPRGG